MVLIRLLSLNCLKYNRRIWVQYVKSEENILADSLSRLDFKRFWCNAPPNMDRQPTSLSTDLWPVSKIWMVHRKCYTCATHAQHSAKMTKAQKD